LGRPKRDPGQVRFGQDPWDPWILVWRADLAGLDRILRFGQDLARILRFGQDPEVWAGFWSGELIWQVWTGFGRSGQDLATFVRFGQDPEISSDLVIYS